MTATGSDTTTFNAETGKAAEILMPRILCGCGELRVDRGVAACLSLLFVLFAAVGARAATSEIADAAMRGDLDAVHAALTRRADVNTAQVDGSTALHWAV